MAKLNTKAVYKALRRNALRKVKYFKSDWRIDRNALRKAASQISDRTTDRIEFVHVASVNGTHMWFLYFDNIDTEISYLFGRATPRKIMTDIASIFSTSSMSISSDATIQHFNGETVRVIDRNMAQKIFQRAAARH